MSEQPDTNQNVGIAITRQYIKDLSLEVLDELLPTEVAPKIEINVDVSAQAKGNDTYVSQLSINMTSKHEDKTLFILELTYAAYAEIHAPQEHIEPILMIEIPRLMFPFARSIVTHCLTEGGMPPFMLNPIDFASIYVARKQAETAAVEEKAKEEIVN